MSYRRIPRGYNQMQYPQPHNFSYQFKLNLEDETKNSAICTLLRTSEVATGVSAIEVNPRNAAFAEDAGPLIHMGSIVPRLNITMLAKATDAVTSCILNYMPIYTAFLNNLEAADDKTDTQIEDVLMLQHDTTNKDVYPLHANVNLEGAFSQPLSSIAATEAFGDYGLTTDATMESVAFNKENFFDNLQYKTNSSMLKKVTGPMRSIVLGDERPYKFFSRNYTNPIVKRGNPYTFCGILFHLPQVGQFDQVGFAGDTTNIAHVDIKLSCRFDEWNPEFDQSAL